MKEWVLSTNETQNNIKFEVLETMGNAEPYYLYKIKLTVVYLVDWGYSEDSIGSLSIFLVN